MHAELVVPGLLAARPAGRLPALELLLARGRCSSSESRHLAAWLGQAFALGEGPLPAGALTAAGAGEEIDEQCWARLDPVHLRLMRDRLILLPGAALRITAEEAAALADALNAHFAGRLALRVAEPARWAARLGDALEATAECPLELAGRDVDLCLPGGRDAKRAHQLLNEAQMVLHSHPVNEAREARGEAAINSLWLWGTGRKPAAHETRWHCVVADDPLVLGLARSAGVRHQALPANAGAWLERAPEDGRHFVLLDALRLPLALGEAGEVEETLARLERDWFAPLLGALRSGRIGMVSCHIPDGPECVAFETIRGDLRRFWRRPKALETYT